MFYDHTFTSLSYEEETFLEKKQGVKVEYKKTQNSVFAIETSLQQFHEFFALT